MIADKEAICTIKHEAEYNLDNEEWFDEDAADAELQRIMHFYADIIEGELEWNLAAQNMPK